MNSTDISYKEYGSGKPIYFIHGLALDSKSMEYIYEPIFKDSHQYRRIYVDLPGMGKTTLKPNIKGTDDILNLLHSFIENNSNGEKFIICGHSFGGYLGLALLYLLSRKIDKIFLTCPVVRANFDKRTVEKHKIIKDENIVPVNNIKYFDDYLSMNVVINEKTWIDYQKSIIPGLELFDSTSWSKIQKEHYKLNFEEELVQKLPMTKGIVLLGEFDNVVGYKDQHGLLLSKVENVTIIPNSGHNLPIDIKFEIEEKFLDFLDS